MLPSAAQAAAAAAAAAAGRSIMECMQSLPATLTSHLGALWLCSAGSRRDSSDRHQ